ncbi:MAG: hypothetical protein NUV65_01950 [Candidatus Roizmanbacteria bacterium]|nr:hypothetical protein [Candidatus Roizmanbacteria bacterium]
MKKEFIIGAAAVFLLLGITYAAYSFTAKDQSTSTSTTTVTTHNLKKSDFIYFWGSTCSHCKELNDWITKNKVDEKLTYKKLEVFYNKKNSNLMEEAAQICKIPSDQVGVPFVYDNGKCYIGTPDAEDHFTERMKK